MPPPPSMGAPPETPAPSATRPVDLAADAFSTGEFPTAEIPKRVPGEVPAEAHGFGKTDALLVLCTTIWGVNFTAVKYGSHMLTPLAFTWLRVVIAMGTLLLVAMLRKRPWPVRADVLRLLGLGVLGNGIYQLLFVSGVSRTRVADAALLVAASPAFTAIFSQMRGIEKVRSRTVTGIVLSFLGVAIVVLGTTRAPVGDASLFGAGIILVAVLCWSVFTPLLRPLTLRVDVIQVNAITMTGGVLPLLFLTPQALSGPAWASLPPMVWLAVFYSSVISMGVAYLFWYRGVRVLGPTRTSVYANLQPAVAILVAWLALGEMPTAWQGLGAATIIAGILLTRT